MSDLLFSALLPVAPNTALLKMTHIGKTVTSPYVIKSDHVCSSSTLLLVNRNLWQCEIFKLILVSNF